MENKQINNAKKNNFMKSNSTKRMIAIAVLLLLAIGAVYIIMNNGRTNNNGQNNTAMTTSQAPDNGLAAITPAPDVTPVPAPTADNSQQGSESTAVIASTSKHRYARSGKHKKHRVTDVDEDQFGIATASNYGGNISAPPASGVAIKTNTVKETPPVAIEKDEEQKVPQQDARTKYGRVNLAPEVGVNLNGLYNNNTSNMFTNGFHAGVMMNIGLGDDFALQPGLMYIMKGGEVRTVSSTDAPETSSPLQVNTSTKTRLHYIELPVNIVYKFGDKPGNPRFMIGAGPYVSYLVSRQDMIQSSTVNDEGFTVSSQKYTTSSMAGMKNFDYGVGGFVGCQMPKGFYAKLGTEWGLMDIVQDPVTGKMSNRNYNFLLSVGYIIGSKNKVY